MLVGNYEDIPALAFRVGLHPYTLPVYAESGRRNSQVAVNVPDTGLAITEDWGMRARWQRGRW